MDLPTEITEEIFGWIDDDLKSVNAFARTCKRYARIVASRAEQIANENTSNFTDIITESMNTLDNIHVNSLPNGTRHGFVYVNNEYDDIFCAKYVLGSLTHYRINIDYDCEWGHADCPFRMVANYTAQNKEVYYVVARCENTRVIMHINSDIAEIVEMDGHKRTILRIPAVDAGHPSDFLDLDDDELKIDALTKWATERISGVRAIMPTLPEVTTTRDKTTGVVSIDLAIHKYCPGW